VVQAAELCMWYLHPINGYNEYKPKTYTKYLTACTVAVQRAVEQNMITANSETTTDF
jgi:hypothetical protein